ncbi:MAG TPA: MBL fold metallo-hydrolase [Pyrinomonadaceae bacterium]|jgi:L-ascorbate metabolism protein UlaG (beta-lactamase superfamily)
MSQKPLYHLAHSSVVEPLVNKWAAWPHVLAPVASSLHLQNYQIKLLESFLQDPEMHIEACRSPKLRSGPFVALGRERVDEVSRFLADTRKLMSGNLELAKSLVEFHNYLSRTVGGESLEPFYEKIPEPLRGYVELMYDYYNHPIVRCQESLLYQSPYYQRSLQSLRIFQHKNDHSRPFFQSTPRLPEREQIEWSIPFDSPRVDDFFNLDSSPRPLEEIRELLGLSSADEQLLLSFLTDEPVSPREKWDSDMVRIRMFGHASALIEWNGTSILVDPYVSVTPSEGGIDRFSFDSLPEKIDYVLITHLHQDHFCLETLLRLRRKIGCLVVPRSYGMFYADLSLKLLARKIGFPNVVELDALESIPLPGGGEIIGVPFLGEHADLPHGKSGYVIRAGREQILFGADSDCLDGRMYEHLRRMLGTIQTVFLGMECVGAPLSWSCGPLLPAKPEFSHDQSRRCHGCDSERALSILKAVGARRVYIYAMGLEPWMEHLLGLAYTEDARQIREARRLIEIAPAKSFIDAELLFGRCEIILDGERAPHFTSYSGLAPSLQGVALVEDQFSFD